MSILIPIAILAFLVSPFALAGFQRTWRVTLAILLLLAVYTAFEWSRPIPTNFDEQDQFGAAAWQMILLITLVAGAMAYAAGFTVSALRTRFLRKRRD